MISISRWSSLGLAALFSLPMSAGAVVMTPYELEIVENTSYQALRPEDGEVIESPIEAENLHTGTPRPQSSFGSAALDFPFPVRFYGTTYTQGAAAPRGIVTFGPRSETLCGGADGGDNFGSPKSFPSCASAANRVGPLPRAAFPNRLLAPWWEEGFGCAKSDAPIKHQTRGAEPSRVFVVEWSGCGKGTDVSTTFNFQAWFFEGQSKIEVHYDGVLSPPIGSGRSMAAIGLMSPAPGGGEPEGLDTFLRLCPTNDCTRGEHYPAGKTLIFRPGPDLAIESIDTDKSVVVSGMPLKITAVLKNIGGVATPASKLHYFLSRQPSIVAGAEDLGVSADEFPLEVDESRSVEQPVTMPAALIPGTYYVVVRTDPTALPGERNTQNNTKASLPIYVSARMPSLEVTSVSLDAGTIVPGAPFWVEWTIHNGGSENADVPYAVMLSTDQTISLADRLIYSTPRSAPLSIAAGAEERGRISVTLPPDVEDGIYAVGLLLDPDRTLSDLFKVVPSLASDWVVASPPGLRILTTSLPEATLGADYCVRLDAVGGGSAPDWTPPSWSVVGGEAALPPGIRLETFPAYAERDHLPFITRLCGRAEALGTFSFTLRVEAGDQAEIQAYELLVGEVLSPLRIVSADLPVASFMASFDTRLRAAGGKSPYTWTLEPGSRLPGGLVFRKDGAILGSSLEDGRFSFSVRVVDAEGRGVSKDLTLMVTAPEKLTCGSRMLPAHEVDEPYELMLSAAGGKKPYQWKSRATKRLAVETGEVEVPLGEGPPPGLTLDGLGNVGGMPVQAGRYLWTVEVRDAADISDEASCTLVVDVAGARGLTVSVQGLAPARVGWPYRASLAASGGVGALRWSVVGDSQLPQGLILGSDGTIEGFPEASQLDGHASRDVPFVVEVRDSNNRRGVAPLSIQILASVSPVRPSSSKSSGCSSAAGAELSLIAAALALGRRKRR